MGGAEGLLILLSMIAVGSILAVPIYLMISIGKLLNRQDETSRRVATMFGFFQDELAEQKRLLRNLLNRDASGSTGAAPPTELVTQPVEQYRPPPVEEIRPEPEVIPSVILAPTIDVVPTPPSRPSRPISEILPPAPTPQSPRQPSRFESAAKEILLKIWHWIIVGEEHRPVGVSMEYAVASTWLVRLGVLILVMGMGFFLKYSIDHDFIGPRGRVGLAILAGVGLLLAGMRLLDKTYHGLGLGLVGAGIATLYFAAFAAFNFHHLIDVSVAFALMILITVCAAVLAVRFNALLIAILGLLGGYGTPIMLHTGVVNYPGLFSYVLLLGCGVLGISYKKKWYLLNYLSFVCTYVLFFGAMQNYKVEDFWQVMPFLTAFFMLFSTMVFFFNLFSRTPSNLLDSLALLVNAGIYFGVSYGLVSQAFDYRWVSVVTLALAAFYVAHVWYCLIFRVLDRDLLSCFIALAAFFLAVTIPLALSPEWITVSWAIQAFVMLWLAGKLKSEFLRHVAYLLYVIVIGRFAMVDLMQQYSGITDAMPLAAYFQIMSIRLLILGIPIVSLAGAFYLLKSPASEVAMTVDRANDISPMIHDRWALYAAMLCVAGMAFAFLHLEFNRTFLFLFPPLRLPILSLLWVGMCVFLLYEYLAVRNNVILATLITFACLLLGKLLVFDLDSWQANETMLYGGTSYSFLDAGMRLLDFGAIIAFLFFAFRLLAGDIPAKLVRNFSGFLSLALLFIFLSLEVNTFLSFFVPGLQAGGVSILWSIFAIGCLLGGIWRNIKALRFIALGLFAVVSWKVIFVDLARLDPLYRIVAFIVLGILVLCGSFIYLKYRSTFVREDAATEDETT